MPTSRGIHLDTRLRLAGLLMALVAHSGACGELGLADPLTDEPGDVDRGRTVVLDPQRGDCTSCHDMALANRELHGNLGPTLDGIASRRSRAEIRLQIVDPKRVNPATTMPSYFAVEGLHRVALAFRGRSILSSQEIEDVVAFLMTFEAAP